MHIDGDDPAALPAEQTRFQVTIRKSPGRAGLGLELDVAANHIAHVDSITEKGPIWSYNKHVRPAVRVRPGDYLVSINGVTGDGQALLQEFEKSDESTLELCRPKLWEAMITKPDTEGFGLEFAAMSQDSKALCVEAVKHGAVQKFNEAHRGRTIKVGDRIVSVAGAAATSAPEMIALLTKTSEVNFLVSRPQLT